jgi:L-iditol 2-dehydrogenase
MQAAVLHGKEDVCIESIPIPVPADGEIIVRVAAALTDGTDLKVFRRGYHARMLQPPCVFGHEFAGTVSAIGSGVTNFSVGDRVVALNSAPCGECFYCSRNQQNLCDALLFNNGAYAEYIRVPARIVAKNTLRIPDEIQFAHAAMTEPLACVMRGIEESHLQPNDIVAVIGAGGIGLMFIHAASLLGARVIAVVKHAAQAEAARKLGATDLVLTSEAADPIEAVRALTPGSRGADIVFEAVATPLTWQWAVDMARKGGTVNFFGGPPSGTKVELDTNRLHYNDITLKASFHHTPSTARAAFDLIASGRFNAAVFITDTAPLADLPKVFAEMAAGQRGIKTAIIP